MILWLIITALALLTACLLFVPESGERGNTLPDVDDDRSFYERRLLDIDLDLQEGRISAEDCDAMRAEAARKLINLSQKTSHTGSEKNWSRFALFAALAFVPVFSISLYSHLGRPYFTSSAQAVPVNASLNTMIRAAEVRLETMPDDLKGWEVLAPVYKRLGRYDDAINANRNLIRLSGRKPELLFALGEVMVLKDDNQVSEQAETLFAEALELVPENPGAMYYTGLAKAQSGDEQTAKSTWSLLLQQSQGDEPWVMTTLQNLRSLGMKESELGELFPHLGIAVQMNSLSPEERNEQIEGMVASLASKLEVDPNDKEGWVRLIRSQIVLGKLEEAVNSGKVAKATFPDDEPLALLIDNMLKETSSSPEPARIEN